MTFMEKLMNRQKLVDSILCCGLDIDEDLIPESIDWRQVSVFIEEIVDAVAEFICSFKINLAFYLISGWLEIVLQDTIGYIQKKYPEIPLILDAKWGEVPHVAEKYVRVAFERLKVDAVTINPYLGQDSCQPFLDQKDKGIFILCKTSNADSRRFQDLRAFRNSDSYPQLYEHVAEEVRSWNSYGNCGLVMGANYPEALRIVRRIVGDMLILVPAIGAQSGDLEGVIKYGLNSFGGGLIISSSRSITYASKGPDYTTAAAKEAKQLRDRINQLKRGMRR